MAIIFYALSFCGLNLPQICKILPQSCHEVAEYPDGNYLLLREYPIAARFSNEGILLSVGIRRSFGSFLFDQPSAPQGIWKSQGYCVQFDQTNKIYRLSSQAYTISVYKDIATLNQAPLSLTGVVSVSRVPFGRCIRFTSPFLYGPDLDEGIQFKRYCFTLSSEWLLIIASHRSSSSIEMSLWRKQ